MPGEAARSDPRPSVRVTRGAVSGQHLASVLQEGRENANIDGGLGFHLENSRMKLTPFARFVVTGFAVATLVAAQLMLSAAIHGANYSGGDGKLAQATILIAYKFGNLFDFNSFNPT